MDKIKYYGLVDKPTVIFQDNYADNISFTYDNVDWYLVGAFTVAKTTIKRKPFFKLLTQFFNKKHRVSKKLKFKDNEVILCANCNKPRYMGYTYLRDSELCTCPNQGDDSLVYHKNDEHKTLHPFSKFYTYA